MKDIKINYDKTFATKYSRDYYRGSSFHWAGEWKAGIHYVSDSYNVDFVTYNNVLLACSQSHTSTPDNIPNDFIYDEDGYIIGIHSKYWDIVLSGNNAAIQSVEVLKRRLETEIRELEHTMEETDEELRSDYRERITNLESEITTAYETIISQTAQEIRTDAKKWITDAEGNITEAYTSAISQTAEEINATVAANKTDADGKITNLQSELSITAEEINSRVTSEVETLNGKVDTKYSEISQRADEINATVVANKKELDGTISENYSALSLRADEISAEVVANKESADGSIENLNSRITQTAGEITSTVEAYKEELDGTISNNYSVLDQKADSISATVTANKESADNSFTQLQSDLTITADTIRSEVSEVVGRIDGDIDTAKSSITQTAAEIRSEVETTKTDLEGTISSNYSELKQTANEISSTVTAEVTAREALGERVTTAESNITQNADAINQRVTKTDYNNDQNTINKKISDLTTDTEGIHASVSSIEATIGSQGDAITNYATRITSLERQADNAIETWYYHGAPTLNNSPAKDWTDNETRKNHIGDLYYDRNTGYSYRFMENNGTYSWDLIQDSDITKAIENAAAAQETADGKMKVFTATPYTPYQIGDLWVQGHTANNDGTIYKCITGKESGAFSAADWAIASDFTSFKEVRSNFDVLADAIEGKVGEYDESGLIKGSTYSRIKQTRDNITLEVGTAKQEAIDNATTKVGNVTTGLLNTGINISNKKIDLTADNIVLKNNSGERALVIENGSDGKPVLGVSNLNVASLAADNAFINALQVKHLNGADGTFSGTLSAASGSFSGKITATDGTIGGININNSSIASENNNFSVDSNGNVIANSITLANGAISSGINTYGFTFGKTNNISYLYNGKSSLNASGEGIYIGTDGIALGNSFKVTKDGTISLSYSSLSDKPTIPTKTGDLTNDGTYITPTSLTTINVTAENLKVKAANISGTLTVGNIPDLSSKYLTEHQSLTDYMQTATYIENGYIKTGLIEAGSITVDKLAAGAISTSQLKAVDSNFGIVITPGKFTITRNDEEVAYFMVDPNNERFVILRFLGPDGWCDITGSGQDVYHNTETTIIEPKWTEVRYGMLRDSEELYYDFERGHTWENQNIDAPYFDVPTINTYYRYSCGYKITTVTESGSTTRKTTYLNPSTGEYQDTKPEQDGKCYTYKSLSSTRLELNGYWITYYPPGKNSIVWTEDYPTNYDYVYDFEFQSEQGEHFVRAQKHCTSSSESGTLRGGETLRVTFRTDADDWEK